MKNKCKQCKADSQGKKYCCHKCKWTWHNRNRTLKPNLIYDCKICGNHVEKWVSPLTIRQGVNTGEYCSRTCAGVGRMGENHHQWKGGRKIDKDGYVYRYSPNHPNATKAGYVFEHRLVMEAKIGRYLTDTEVVHHKDDDTSNNAIENLHLYDSNAAHKSEDYKHRKIDERGRLMPKKGKKNVRSTRR